MYTDNDGQNTLPDESTREVIDYCRSIQGKDLEVFKRIAGPAPDLSDIPPEYEGLAQDIAIDHERAQGALEGIKAAIDFYADYSEPVTADEIIDHEESDPEALLDLISVLRTTEALIRVRKSLPSSGLPSKDIEELDSELSETIDQGAALLATFFQNEHRYFYETVGDFDCRAAEICIALADKLAGDPAESGNVFDIVDEIFRSLELDAKREGGLLSLSKLQEARAKFEAMKAKYHEKRVRSGRAKGFASARGKTEAEQKPQILNAILYTRTYPAYLHKNMKERTRDFLEWRQTKEAQGKLRYRPGQAIGETQARVHLQEANEFLKQAENSE